MKSTKYISIIAITTAVIAYMVSFPYTSLNLTSMSIADVEPYYYSPQQEALDNVMNKFEEFNHVNDIDNLSNNNLEAVTNELRDDLFVLQEQINISVEAQQELEAENIFTDSELMTFYMKSILSLIFCLFSIYVILSRKYSEGTEKIALSVLSTIAGVWIGSIG